MIAGLYMHTIILGALHRRVPNFATKGASTKSLKDTSQNVDVIWTSDISGKPVEGSITHTLDFMNNVIINTSSADKQSCVQHGPTPSYIGLMRRPRVIRAFIIGFLGVTGDHGKS